MFQLSQSQIITFQKKILLWYSLNKRELPWRKTHNPYKILLSEVMSQQTQISRVITKYEEWLKELPTIESLSSAPLSQVLRLWSGLGYNRRAVYLQQTAQIITQRQNGKFPQNLPELKKLPGLGEYTASAVLCFAFNQQIPVVDTNIRKVIYIELLNPSAFDKDISQNNENKRDIRKESLIHKIAKEILPYGKAYDWNQALMDYAAAELKSYKIPIPKQSKLIGSDRWYRGQIIKLLIKYKSLTRQELFSALEKEEDLTSDRYEKIVRKLIKDSLIEEKNKHLKIL